MTSRRVNGPSSVPASGVARWVTHPAAISLLLALATLAVYWPVAGYDFITLDDPVYVSENPQVLGGMTWENVRWAFSTTGGGSWHPLTWISLLVDGQLFGSRAGGYHVVNLLLHVLNTLLLFGLLRQLTGGTGRSAAVAALFALHPLHVESVAWVSERKDVLSTVFWMLTLWAYAHYVARRDPQTAARSSAAKHWYATALVLFALGLMSKPMLVTLPFVMLLLDYWPLQRAIRFTAQASASATRPTSCPRLATVMRLCREKLPFFLLSAAASAVTIWAQRRSEAVVSLEWIPLSGRVENALISYARYLGQTLWPTDLAVFYPRPESWDWLPVAASATLVVGLSAAALRLARSHPFLATGWFWFVGTLIPVIGLVQVGAQSRADRYTYVPLIGVFIALAWGVAARVTVAPADRWRRRLIGAVAGLVLIPCAVRTSAQLRHWQDSETLFRQALAVTQNNAVAHGSLGSFLLAKGRFEEAAGQSRLALAINPESTEAWNNLGLALAGLGRWKEAEGCYRSALKLKPGAASALNSLGLALANQGLLAEATEQFRLSLEARPESAEVLNNLGLALALQGRTDEAVGQYHHALKLKPDLDRALNNLGLALASQKRLDEAMDSYRRALRANPDSIEARVNLGAALSATGQTEEAIRNYREALRLQPDNPEALNNLGMLLSGQGQTEEAIQCFRQALQRQPNHPQVLNNLGVALAGQGRAEEAIRCFEGALRSKPDYAEAHACLGQVLAKQGRREAAIRHLTEALRLLPGNAVVQDQLRALGAADSLTKQVRAGPPGPDLQPTFPP